MPQRWGRVRDGGRGSTGLARQRLPSPYRYDGTGTLRVTASAATLAEITRGAADPIARAGVDNVEIVARLIAMVLLVAERARHAGDRKQLLDLARYLREEGEAWITGGRDRQMLAERYEACLARFQARLRPMTIVPTVAPTDVSRRTDGGT